MYDVAIIGAGVVGCALARHLARFRLHCALVERANDVGTGTSKANTAILHTGFDTEPGTLESALVRRGHQLLGMHAHRAGIALERVGALLVAWTPPQADELDSIVDKARRNRCRGARRVAEDELYRREPHLGPGALGAVEIPDESIICPWSTTIAFALEAVGAGVDLRLGTTVTGVRPGGDHWELLTGTEVIRAQWVVNAAGLAGDLVDRWFGHGDFSITPRKGQLIVFDKLARPLLHSILLPVPTPRSKGVLVAPTVYGNLLLGPTAEDQDDRTDVATTGDGLASLLAAAQRILPAVAAEEVTATYAGLRAATEHRDYQISVHPEQRYACIGGIRSTGLSSSMAIAEHVTEQLGAAGLSLEDRDEEPAVPRVPPLGESRPRPYQQPELVAADPAYGHILCFCERVSEGEIRDALAGPLPARDLGGIRRRTRATNGRCQAFYCGASVAALLRGEVGS